jgi:uncharacterized protein (DUF1919 family)
LILGRHVFAHIDDLKDLVAGLEAVSHAETLIAFEVPYVVDFFEHTEYDTIYHEHLSYISAASIEALVKDSAFMLARVDHYPIHGGSILFHLRHRSSKARRTQAWRRRWKRKNPCGWPNRRRGKRLRNA